MADNGVGITTHTNTTGNITVIDSFSDSPTYEELEDKVKSLDKEVKIAHILIENLKCKLEKLEKKLT